MNDDKSTRFRLHMYGQNTEKDNLEKQYITTSLRDFSYEEVIKNSALTVARRVDVVRELGNSNFKSRLNGRHNLLIAF